MHVGDIVPPTLAVVVSWIVLGALIAGVGHAMRRVLLRVGVGQAVDTFRPADLWIGLAALVAYLQLWNLVAAVSWKATIVPVVTGLVGLGLVGLGLGARRLRGFKSLSLSWPIVAGVVVAVLWLANRSLAAAFYYDLGLYHFAAIDYASQFAAIPGLGNLHGRLGAGNGHLLRASSTYNDSLIFDTGRHPVRFVRKEIHAGQEPDRIARRRERRAFPRRSRRLSKAVWPTAWQLQCRADYTVFRMCRHR